MKKYLRFLAAAVFFAALFIATAGAEDAVYHDTAVKATGFSPSQNISDGSRYTYCTAGENATVTLTRKGGIASLYIEFDRLPSPWTLTDPTSGTSVVCGTHTFLHEFVDVSALFGGLPEALTLSFPEGIVIADLYAFSAGDLPDWVQIWEKPCEQADLLLISSHSDDEQLFFAGVLPYYAIERPGLRPDHRCGELPHFPNGHLPPPCIRYFYRLRLFPRAEPHPPGTGAHHGDSGKRSGRLCI